MTSLLGGGLFLFIIFLNSDPDNISMSTRKIIYGFFTASCATGNVLLALLTMPSRRKLLANNEERKMTQMQFIFSFFRLLFTRNMLLLSVAFAYSGIIVSFWTGIFPTSISFTLQLGATHKLTSLNTMVTGVGQIIGGTMFGIMGERFRRFGRIPIILVGTVAHLLCFAASFVNFPFKAPLDKTWDDAYITSNVPTVMVCALLLGLGDAAWNTQFYSILVTMYNSQSAQAFSIMKFWQALCACAAFFYGSHLELPWQLLILTVFCLAGCVCFSMVERKAHRQMNGVRPMTDREEVDEQVNKRMDTF